MLKKITMTNQEIEKVLPLKFATDGSSPIRFTIGKKKLGCGGEHL